MEEKDLYFTLLSNIPPDLRSKDLRDFFSDFVERKLFHIFHYLHRKQKATSNNNNILTSSDKKPEKKRQCFVSFSNWKIREDFIKKYHRNLWKKGSEELSSLCLIQKISPPTYLFEKSEKTKYVTNREKKTDKTAKLEYLELHPPLGLPNGNVGTPLGVIHENVDRCILPPSVLIGTADETNVYRKYGQVFLDYGTNTPEDEYISNTSEDPLLHPERDYKHKNKSDSNPESMADPTIANIENTYEDQEAEEWERWTSIPRDEDEAIRYLYEDEIEKVWEKGGSGLVFYTDAVYWDQLRGDFDEQEVDDWDVQFSENSEKIPSRFPSSISLGAFAAPLKPAKKNNLEISKKILRIF